MRAAPGRPRWKARLARALGLDGNPLRRASDRAEAWIRAGLLVILLIAGPMAALTAGQRTAHAAGTGTTAQQRAVQAVLLQPATVPAGQALAGRVLLASCHHLAVSQLDRIPGIRSSFIQSIRESRGGPSDGGCGAIGPRYGLYDVVLAR